MQRNWLTYQWAAISDLYEHMFLRNKPSDQNTGILTLIPN